MLDNDDVVSLESHVRELTESALEAARERATYERQVTQARAEHDTAKRELPEAEREAKERRQAQNDAIRGRADLEHRLAELVEAEDLTRARRQQAEQRAMSFRAAAAFASTGRTEADGSHDAERSERERLVEDRATREAATAEARAAEELAEETKLARHRAEIEAHVEAERALEAEIAADRSSAEARVVELREIVERAAFALHEGEVHLERLSGDRDRLTVEQAAAGEKLREIGDRARVEIEHRIASLREREAGLAGERVEQERLLYALLENERRIEAASRGPEPEPIVEEPRVEALAETATHENRASDGVASARDSSEAEHETPAPSAALEDVATHDHFSTVTFTTAPTAPRDERSASPVIGDDDDRGPGFRSLIGNIFTRRKPDEPIVDEGPSIAERIARDFGLLGADEHDEAGHESEPLVEASASVQEPPQP